MIATVSFASIGRLSPILAEADVGLHDRLMTARRDPDAIERLEESNLLVDLAPHLEDFIGELFGIDAEVRALQARHHELAPLYSVKRLFVQRRAVKGVKEADAVAIDGPALAGELDRLMGAPPDEPIAAWERRYAEHVAQWLEDEAGNAGPLEIAQRYAAWATLSPEGRRKHRRGVLFKVPHRLDMHHLVPVETVERDGVTMLRLPEDEWRRRDGFALTDPGTDLDRRARPGELLHLVPQPGQGQLLEGAQGEGRRLQEERLRRHPRGLPARGEDLRDEPGEGARQQPRRPRHRRRRQPDLRRDRAPHLQRLHEGLHLPAAGPGRHPADRDPHLEGRAGAPLGVRDLLAADPLEPAQHPAAVAAAGDRLQGARRRARAGGLHARASPDERRPFRRGDRRAEDRASAARDRRRRARRHAAARSSRSAMSRASSNGSTTASWPGSAGSPNTASRSAGTRIS